MDIKEKLSSSRLFKVFILLLIIGIVVYIVMYFKNKINPNIISAYTYNSSLCITGEEKDCKENYCYKTKVAGSCVPGTIIKYKVNKNEEKYFYVLHDDGTKLTLQQRENTIVKIAWDSYSTDNDQGPSTVLSEVEKATSTWNNVNDISYALGTDTLYGSKYTGCVDLDNTGKLACDRNTYVMQSRKAKSRIITIQETSLLGCNTSDQSCPLWMYNYLYGATERGGTTSSDDTFGYWTLSADPSGSNFAWIISNEGSLRNNIITIENGVRAVVEINKY